MLTRNWCIYSLIDPRNGLARYVGFTSQPIHVRIRKHLTDAKKHSYRCARWLQSLAKIGIQPDYVILHNGAGPLWREAEQFWISELISRGFDLTNSTEGGEGAPGRVLSEQTKAKIAASHLGKITSHETRAIISLRGKGKPKPPGFGAKVSRGLSGTPLTDERRLNISRSLTGRKLSPDHCAKLSAAGFRRKRSQESIAKFKATMLARPSGFSLTEETKRKISESRIRLFQKRNHLASS